jgi:hypothetical protein
VSTCAQPAATAPRRPTAGAIAEPAAALPAPQPTRRPLLLVDVDGVVSLFGFPPQAPPEGAMHWIDGIPHFLSTAAARHLRTLAADFELVWCSGWEERANEYLPHLLGLPRGLPFLRFGRDAGATASEAPPAPHLADASEAQPAPRLTGAAAGVATVTATRGHWKLAAIDAYAGDRALAWIDDALDEPCHAWAAARAAPTLLVPTTPARGLTEREVRVLRSWLARRTA